MRLRRCLLVALVIALTTSTSVAWAGGLRWRNGAATEDVLKPSRTPNGRPVDPGRFPKYYGGFHARGLQNLGVPTGDTGLRGNGFSMYAW